MVDFPLVLIELFSLGVTAEVLRANIGSKSAISLQRGDPKFQVEGVALINHSSSRLNDLSYSINIWTDLSSLLSQSTRLTDRQMDRRTPFSSLVRPGIPCSAEKRNGFYNSKLTTTTTTLTTKIKQYITTLGVVDKQTFPCM